MAKQASKVFVAKDRKVSEFKPAGKASKELVEAMLGPTGNLRAPTIRKAKTVVVGFDEELFEQIFG